MPEEHATKVGCERCARAFVPGEPRFACSYGCTYCAECTAALDRTCRNCGGTLDAAGSDP